MKANLWQLNQYLRRSAREENIWRHNSGIAMAMNMIIKQATSMLITARQRVSRGA